jgi:hypothetical protein
VPYHGCEGEDVRRLVKLAFKVTLWTAPVIIASQHPFDAPPFRKIGCIFEVDELHLLDNCPWTGMVVIDHDIVRLDI